MRSGIEEFLDRRQSICIVGLGYVGLPLAACLASKFRVVGFDINPVRVRELTAGLDRTREVSSEALAAAQINFTTDPGVIADCRLVIVTVPTPVDENHRPDLRPILGATHAVGKHLSAQTTVVYESTVYPGLTEEECVPILEKESGLTWKKDFFVGYSPERINPGDRTRSIDRIMKVVAGDTPETSTLLVAVYGAVIPAGIHPAETIAVAEAAKVIENTQRDLNIALMNELAVIFGKLGISTEAVLKAAGTKWNFLPFKPGLVGGHCIGVDPYYLTHKAESAGYHPQVILAGRRINDSMGKYVAEKTVKLMIQANRPIKNGRVLILGFTFKENVSDIRNTRVIDIVRELADFGVETHVYDPCADAGEAHEEYGIDFLKNMTDASPYEAVIVAVAHQEFRDKLTLDTIAGLSAGTPILIDIKWLFDPAEAQAKGILHWQL